MCIQVCLYKPRWVGGLDECFLKNWVNVYCVCVSEAKIRTLQKVGLCGTVCHMIPPFSSTPPLPPYHTFPRSHDLLKFSLDQDRCSGKGTEKLQMLLYWESQTFSKAFSLKQSWNECERRAVFDGVAMNMIRP